MSENDGQDGSETDGQKGPQVNRQIVEAVKKSTKYAFGVPEPDGKSPATKSSNDTSTPKYDAGMAIATQKVAQATAYAVQDATDYQRNMLSINGAAQGKALAKMFEDVSTGDATKLGEHAVIYVLSLLGSMAAGYTAASIGENAGKVLESYKNPCAAAKS